ncbi:MAG: hypothetical protein O2796_03215 [Bacteroidetes bacterium]|jgi:hypothetical protein|nr:hypothetical protein [Bacteroidota bacterium]MDA0879389.1 hypothetical protein [Bacteroidota bacterium]MDA1114995.1 hypothetical protein [Bacteroidota bacterium]MDP4664913.1 hypothetical protein [Flavobacteriaceae bacterium]
MRIALPILWILALSSIIVGIALDIPKVVGSGVVLLFFVVFPVFSYHRWKNKKVSDYLLNKENLDKMKQYNDSKS